MLLAIGGQYKRNSGELTYFISDVLRLGEHLTLSWHADAGLVLTGGVDGQIWNIHSVINPLHNKPGARTVLSPEVRHCSTLDYGLLSWKLAADWSENR